MADLMGLPGPIDPLLTNARVCVGSGTRDNIYEPTISPDSSFPVGTSVEAKNQPSSALRAQI
jgi:hypothetical protein